MMDNLNAAEKLAFGLAELRPPDDYTRESRLLAFLEFMRAGKRDRAWRILTKRPVCGSRRANSPLRCLAMPVRGKKRCKRHGGMSTGARTPEGIERIAAAQRRRWAKFRAEKAAADLFAD